MEEYPDSCAVLVRRHGVYVWGDTWQKAKTMCECLDYLCDIATRMKLHGLDPTTKPMENNAAKGYDYNSRWFTREQTWATTRSAVWGLFYRLLKPCAGYFAWELLTCGVVKNRFARKANKSFGNAWERCQISAVIVEANWNLINNLVVLSFRFYKRSSRYCLQHESKFDQQTGTQSYSSCCAVCF